MLSLENLGRTVGVSKQRIDQTPDLELYWRVVKIAGLLAGQLVMLPSF
jgi:hypothetical protein